MWAIDQRQLPWREQWLELHSARDVAEAIKTLAIRGAPLIGVAAAYGVALELRREGGHSLDFACELLRTARPTAANLARAVERVRAAAAAGGEDDAPDRALAAAADIEREEELASEAMAARAADLLSGARTILTHCNTGALAAPGRGTALAAIAELQARGEPVQVIATESRPLLQGARLTAYELGRLQLPHELVVDAAAPGIIAAGQVDAVAVGCDRVAANGDVANKVGTYGLALAARAAQVRFVVVGPTSTIDLTCASAEDIVIEQRGAEEVRSVASTPLAPAGTACRNPAFDLTPAALISALVTEHGIAQPVCAETVSAIAGA